MIEAIVFDMDGLIFDSERIVQRSWEDTGNKLGIPHLGSHIYHTLGMNVVARREYFTRAIGEHFPHEEFAEGTRERFYEIVEEEGLPVKPGVRELLEYGRKSGYKMALATSSRRPYAEGILKDAGLLDYFDGMVFGNMVSHSKPDPEIYLMACEQIGAAPEHSIALEDAPNGIRAAHAAGMIPVMVPDLVQPSEEIKKLVYRQFETLHEVIPLLEKMKIYEGRPQTEEGRLEKEIKVYDLLDSLDISYSRVDHEPLQTIAAREEVDQILGIKICKNLFLCNRQKTAFYLLLLPGNKPLQTKELSKQIPTSRLSFASGEDMEKYLNVTPGSATIMGLIFDPENKVQLVIDEELLEEEYFGCHPCINTSCIKLRTEDVLGKYLDAVGHEYIKVSLSDVKE